MVKGVIYINIKHINQIKNFLNTPITDITKKIGIKEDLPYLIGCVAVGTLCSIAGVKLASDAKRTECVRYEHQIDSAMEARGMDINDIQGRLQVQKDILSFDAQKMLYNRGCKEYQLDPNLSETPKQLQELKILKQKMDSIKKDNAVKSSIK